MVAQINDRPMAQRDPPITHIRRSQRIHVRMPPEMSNPINANNILNIYSLTIVSRFMDVSPLCQFAPGRFTPRRFAPSK